MPIPLLDTPVSSLSIGTNEAEELLKAKLIIIDEITMLIKDGLHFIDLFLWYIMSNDKPFGGKTLVFGGDFRQTIPVVRKGTRTDVLKNCIKSNPFWSIFNHLKFTENMRSCGQKHTTTGYLT